MNLSNSTLIKLQEKEIEQGLRLMEERYYDENFIKMNAEKIMAKRLEEQNKILWHYKI